MTLLALWLAVAWAGAPADLVRVPLDEATFAAVFGPSALDACPVPRACSLTLRPGLVVVASGRDLELVVVRSQLWLPAAARQWHDARDPTRDVGAPLAWATKPPADVPWHEVPDPLGAPAASLAVWKDPRPSIGGHARVVEGALVVDAVDAHWTPMWSAGLREGDVLKRVGGAAVSSWTAVEATVAASTGPVTFEGTRDGSPFTFTARPVHAVRCWKVWVAGRSDGPVDAVPGDAVEVACPAGAAEL